jgi:hypothetical protein
MKLGSTEYPAVAGHQLHHMVDPHFGDLIRVGNTDRAYTRLGDAVRDACTNALTYDILGLEYLAFAVQHRLTFLGAADEHLFDDRLTDEQRLWLIEFCRRWQSVAEFEAEQEEGRRDQKT